MKILWLEKMAEEGLIRGTILEDIYRDVELVKKAASKIKSSMEVSPEVQKDLVASLNNSKLVVLSAYTTTDKPKAGARFDEIARISPVAAFNPQVASKLVEQHLHSGLSDDTVQKLTLFQSQMQKPLFKNATVRPEVLGDMVADIYLIKEAAKLPGPGMSDRTKNFLGSLALLTGTALGVNVLGGLTNWAASKFKKEKAQDALNTSFREALKGTTTNAELLRSKPEAARNAFQTLTHFAPTVALNPVAARGFMAKLVEFGQGGVDVSDLKGLTEVQRNMAGIEPAHPFVAGFAGTSDILGMGKVVQHGALGAQASMLGSMTGTDLDDVASSGYTGLRAKPEKN